MAYLTPTDGAEEDPSMSYQGFFKFDGETAMANLTPTSGEEEDPSMAEKGFLKFEEETAMAKLTPTGGEEENQSMACEGLCKFEKETAMAKLRRDVRYLIGFPQAEWVHGKQALPEYLDVYGDSDWAGDEEKRKSTTGVANSLGPTRLTRCR